MKRFRFLVMLASLVLVLLACQLAQQVGEQAADIADATAVNLETEIPTNISSQTEQTDPYAAQATGEDNPVSVDREKPLQSQAAEIRPEEMRTKLTHLSNLMGYQVLDENGDKLGVASDYIVNTCETYIIYIVMEPSANLGINLGERVLVPFEVVTINSGVLDAENETIQVRLIPEQFSGAPTIANGKSLTPTDWESAVRAFWKKWVRIGMLATSCNVSGGPVYKIAYASQLLHVEVYDGQNNLLGVVQDAILEPESGKLGFFIVKPATGEGLVLVQLRAVNIPKEALLPGNTLTLVLTADPMMFWEAKRVTSIEESDDFALQNEMRQYWGH